MNWEETLSEFVDERTVVMGIGSELKSDDGVGIYISEEIKKMKKFQVVVAGPTPEHWIGYIAKKRFEKILIVDAVMFEGKPGEIKTFSIDDLSRRFGLTHSSSLHLFIEYLSEEGRIEETLILAIQPENLDIGETLSDSVFESARRIVNFFRESLCSG